MKESKKPVEQVPDEAKIFANETLTLMGRININIHDQSFSQVANSLLHVKNVCLEIIEGKKTLK